MKQNNNSQIKSGAIISYLGIIISTIASLLYTPWMKNHIGDANYGLYTLAGSLVAVFHDGFRTSCLSNTLYLKIQSRKTM
ncbi:MAG: hypothetical protein ACLTBV_23630 [Enterocloster bolteae]